MKFKDFKETMEYKTAYMLDVYSEETGLEFDDNFSEERLDGMEVVSASAHNDWLSVTLR